MAISGVADYANTYAGYINSANSKKQVTEETGTAKETGETGGTARKTATDELLYLSGKYSGYSFVAGVYQKGTKFGSSNTTNVMIDSRFLAKMANDPELEREYEEQIALLKDLDDQMKSAAAARGWRMECGTFIDKDGNMGGWAIVTKDPNAKSYLQKMSENAEKIRERNAEKKEEKKEIEEKRQTDRQDQETWQEKMDEKYKEELGDKWEGRVVIKKDDGNMAVSKEGDKGNATAVGWNMDIKA